MSKYGDIIFDIAYFGTKHNIAEDEAVDLAYDVLIHADQIIVFDDVAEKLAKELVKKSISNHYLLLTADKPAK